jgi:spore coat protein U-like protein
MTRSAVTRPPATANWQARLGICVSLLAAVPLISHAAPACSFVSETPVSFGVYDVFSAAPNNNGVGNLVIRCSGGGGPFAVTLSTGQSNSYVSRLMRSGSNQLTYNLYISAARTVVWGNGSGGSSPVSVAKNRTDTLSIFGHIPAGQDAAVGFYTDNINATVSF